MRLLGGLAKFHSAKSIPGHSRVEGKHGRHAELSHQRTAGSGDQTSQISLTPDNRSGMERTIDCKNPHMRSQLAEERLHLVKAETCLDERKKLRADVAGREQSSAATQ